MTEVIMRKPFKVRRISIKEAIASLPSVVPLTNSLPPIDLFIGASGFEERILAAPERIEKMGGRVLGLSLLGRYGTNPEDNSKRARELLPLLERLNRSIEFFDAESPASIKASIDSAIDRFCVREDGVRGHIVFDTSGSSSQLIFSVLAAVFRSCVNVMLTILYTPALQYHEPSSANRNELSFDWGEGDLREFGVAEVYYNELYQGMHQDHLPAYVIAFPSMFTERLQRSLGHLGVGPLVGAEKSIHWVLPSTSHSDHQWRRMQIEKCLAALFPYGAEEPGSVQTLPLDSYSCCDVFDYAHAAEIVMEQVESQGGCANISLIHMGAKLQTVGAALALAARPEVALVGARPIAFAAQTYSTGKGETQAVTFESQRAAVKAIQDIGSLKIVPG
ncbi:hypothetical protein E6C67_34360 [Azospirillum sp. TSA2s]|uniref:hypothetical protein n=1 Tax=Azospirillum sp. TSA2s TaxID=709810 RepID=UPI0010A99DE7|nr:hypothetical protein [Azospirillum sp. TSA2s]QCG98712.1 hypothetical protein E6C67_34360 [Azospirillum sp. TSA2s]